MKSLILFVLLVVHGFASDIPKAYEINEIENEQKVYLGIIKANEEVELSSSIDGLLKKVYIKEGEFVKSNTLILKLDDMLQQLDVKRKMQIYKDDSQFQAKKESLDIMKQDYESSKELFEKTGSISLDELNKLKLQYIALDAEVKTLLLKKKQDKIELDIAKEILNKYSLKSPINGYVSKINFEVGEWIKTGDKILKVVNTDTCYAEFNIKKEDFYTIKKNQKINLNITIGNDKIITKKATISFISPFADDASGLVLVKAKFKNDGDVKILPGLSAKINL
jgi:RND family efflux transporter MFP subunit